MKWLKSKEKSLQKNQSMNSHLEKTNYYFLGYERDIEDIKNLNNQMIQNKSHLGTLATKFLNEKSYNDQNVVKVITKEKLDISNYLFQSHLR